MLCDRVQGTMTPVGVAGIEERRGKSERKRNDSRVP